MKPFKEWPNPKQVCQSEYSMIYELVRDAREQAKEDGEDPDIVTKGILEEFSGWATELLVNSSTVDREGT